MKGASLGANCLLSCFVMSHAVVPATGFPSLSVHGNAATPHACTSIPRCCLYHACMVGASFALKKTPPMPVTRFIWLCYLGSQTGAPSFVGDRFDAVVDGIRDGGTSPTFMTHDFPDSQSCVALAAYDSLVT